MNHNLNKQFLALLTVLLVVILLTTAIIRRYDPHDRDSQEAPLPSGNEFFSFVGRGCVALSRGEDVNAERLFLRALELDKNYPFVLDSLAGIYFKRGDYNQALEVYSRLLQLTPENPQVLTWCGVCNALRKQYYQAGLQLRRAVELDPALNVARLHLAGVLAERGDTAGAQREFAEMRRRSGNTVMIIPDMPHFMRLRRMVGGGVR